MAFAAAGYRVVFGDLQVEKGEALARRIGGEAAFIRMDVRNKSDFAGAARTALKRWNRLDCVVNNAAIPGVLGPLAQISLEEYDRTCDAVQRSVFIGMREAAVIALTRSVALELAESGIRVNAVCPGNVETPIHTGVTDDRWMTRMAKIRPSHRDDQAIGRMGQPEEIAAAVLWLASHAASYVTGHALTVDGGLTAGLPWRKQPAHLRELHKAKSL